MFRVPGLFVIQLALLAAGVAISPRTSTEFYAIPPASVGRPHVESAAADTPISVTLTVLSAEATDIGLWLNGQQIIRGFASISGQCNTAQTVITTTTGLTSYNPNACNQFYFIPYYQYPEGDGRFIGWAKVTLTYSSGETDELCLFDGYLGNPHPKCIPRSVCDAPGTSRIQSTGYEDYDGVPDGLGTGCDNCPTVFNPDQTEVDGDGSGNTCDVCPTLYNPDQIDPDRDGVGDECGDNCPVTFNTHQRDDDNDGVGDLCDPCYDPDNDGICDAGIPAAITWTWRHSNQQIRSWDPNSNAYINFSVNGTSVVGLRRDGPAECIWDDDQVTLSDLRTLDLIDPLGCNTFQANIYPADSRDRAGFGYVRVTVTDRLGSESDICLLDERGGSCKPWGFIGDGACRAPSATSAGDFDGDGYQGGIGAACADNCANHSNPDQADADSDGIGDVCDCSDPDGDRMPGGEGAGCFDNCPSHYNPQQDNSDGDDLGNACDCSDPTVNPGDQDADGVDDCIDNCRHVVNPMQEDYNSDGIGDACDADCAELDSDGIGCTDNCQEVDNPGQEDSDDNGIGDACDCTEVPAVGSTVRLDAEGKIFWDSVPTIAAYNVYRGYRNAGRPFQYTHLCMQSATPDASAVDPLSPHPENVFYYLITSQCPVGQAQSAPGEDSLGTSQPLPFACPDLTSDPDGDGTDEAVDNCPGTGNASQANSDGDPHGDQCDNCALRPNTYQENLDGDTLGDACDPDRDGDGILEDYDGDPATQEPCTAGSTSMCDDNCPNVSNPIQQDPDFDGIGTHCDSD